MYVRVELTFVAILNGDDFIGKKIPLNGIVPNCEYRNERYDPSLYPQFLDSCALSLFLFAFPTHPRHRTQKTGFFGVECACPLPTSSPTLSPTLSPTTPSPTRPTIQPTHPPTFPEICFQELEIVFLWDLSQFQGCPPSFQTQFEFLRDITETAGANTATFGLVTVEDLIFGVNTCDDGLSTSEPSCLNDVHDWFCETTFEPIKVEPICDLHKNGYLKAIEILKTEGSSSSSSLVRKAVIYFTSIDCVDSLTEVMDTGQFVSFLCLFV